MYLKRIDMQGFKSFAEKISLEFNSGITAVVGPNGSGKSNIADAIRWVLGEQSIKTLRGSKMEDVIFSGTESRKPLGFAEVSLTIDNSESENRLPIEFNEVTITRRIFRSGESEYLINKTICRLKDITELLFDTGIGKDGYSVIGQGRIDDILSSKSEDRRLIFEEASGIMKYKVRKHEAERKLELTRQNMDRINDIIIELESQIEPLREQSEKAREYLDLREQLKELEINVYLENLIKYKERLKEMEQQYEVVSENLDNENAHLEDITNSNKVKTDYAKELEKDLDSARQQFYVIESNLEKSDSEIALANEKINHLQINISRIEEEKSEYRLKLEALGKEERNKQDKLTYLEKQLADYAKKLSDSENQMLQMLSVLDEYEKSIEMMKSEISDKQEQQADRKIQMHNVRMHLEGIEKRVKSIDSEVYQSTFEKDKEGMKKEDLTTSVYKASEQIRLQNEKLDEFKNELVKSEGLLVALRSRETTCKADLQYKSSRLRTLSEMEERMEGYNRSVKNILQECKEHKSFGDGIHGALAQLITVDKKYETAIELSLGNALQNIVTSTEEDAKKAIEFLKANKSGRATFLPITSITGRSLEASIMSGISKLQGFCGVAADLVAFDSKYSGIILSLLGRVVVIDNLDNAIFAARKHKFSFKIVTLEGDIINAGGSMSGGSSENRGTGILGRNREIAELDEQVVLLKATETKLANEILQLVRMVAEVRKEITSLESDIKTNELIKMRDESHLNQVAENVLKIIGKIDMLKQEKIQLQKQHTVTEADIDKYNVEIAKTEDEIAAMKSKVMLHQEKHREEQNSRDALYEDITDFKISVNSIKESMDSVRENSDRISHEKGILQKSISKLSTEREKQELEIVSLKNSILDVESSILRLKTEKIEKNHEIESISKEKKIVEEDIYDIVNKINDINKSILLLQDDFNRLEVRKIKLETEMEAIQNRMWDEYELTYSSALELKTDIGGITQAQKKINEIRNRVKELGSVNVNAIEEYVKTKERFEFMSVQKNDMEQAAEKLQRVIYEMTSVMKKQFLEQLKLINENFNVVFKELFSGGRAQLYLSEPENVLESGIEIEVQPPGKKLQSMMLLSGGERAFTAIALLFAILKLRPAPFCVLDEIEAALDDANVYRFSEYLRKYSMETQFIMVTHRKGTMEGSDILYGVTMQEHGVSKIVSMKMGEKVS